VLPGYWQDAQDGVFTSVQTIYCEAVFQVLRARKEAAVLEAASGDEYRRYRGRTWF